MADTQETPVTEGQRQVEQILAASDPTPDPPVITEASSQPIPDSEVVAGVLYHRALMVGDSGDYRHVLRPVAKTMEEAREKQWDFYHPEFGWIRYGFKMEKDRSVASIMRDDS